MIRCFVILVLVVQLSILLHQTSTSVFGKIDDEEETFDYGYGGFVEDPEQTQKYEFLDTCSMFIAPSKRTSSTSSTTTHGLYAGHGFTKSHGVSLRYPAGRFPMLDRISEPEGVDGVYRVLSLGPNALLPKPSNCIASSSTSSSSSLSLRYTDRRVGSQRYLDKVVLPQVHMYQPLSARSKYPDFEYVNVSAVEVGQELLAGTSICEARSSSKSTGVIDESGSIIAEQTSYELEELLTMGTCLDNIEVKPSHAHLAGMGVFAKRNLREGEIVAITPVAFLPMRDVYQASDDTCVLVNYCLGHSRSEVALLPLGSVAFLNHGVQNVEYEWYFWGGVATGADNAVMRMSSKTLLARAAASDTPLLYLVYRSKFNLFAGQELQIDYGPAWETESRKYFFDMENFVEFSGPVPQLRRHILAEEGLFPDSWMSN